MSRPTSPERIQLEKDRAIRKERRERKAQIREARQKERLRKKQTHESIVQHNGITPVKADDRYLGLRDAIAYSPLVFCGGCGVIVRENSLIDGVCDSCKFGKEVQSEKSTLKPKGDTEEGSPCGSPLRG
jgi:hypothetical protein